MWLGSAWNSLIFARWDERERETVIEYIFNTGVKSYTLPGIQKKRIPVGYSDIRFFFTTSKLSIFVLKIKTK